MEEIENKKKLSQMTLDDIKRQLFGERLKDDGDMSEQEVKWRMLILGNYLVDNLGDDEDHINPEKGSDMYITYEKELAILLAQR